MSEVNKEQAERCRDIGAEALRSGEISKAIKFLIKSQQLHPLPGVSALLRQAQKRMTADASATGTNSSSGSQSSSTPRPSTYTSPQPAATATPTQAPSRSQSTASSTSTKTGTDGRAYTDAQVKMVEQILRAKEGGRGAHYRVLGVEKNADENALKKAYRKLALKLHPDKNSAPKADDAFKALGLAYATLSDSQKRAIYDRFGEEDPDNRGGGGGGGGHRGRGAHFNGQEVNPEDIFNMFFGGGMPGGVNMNMGGMPGGFRVYSNGFGGARRGGAMPGQQQQRQQEQQGGLGALFQLLPILLLFAMSFFNLPGETASNQTGNSQYFSLTHAPPFKNPLKTKITTVKEIPFFVTDKFMRTYATNRYQLTRVEQMVEQSYKNYLMGECKNQKSYKQTMTREARNKKGMNEAERERLFRKAQEFELSRCVELNELFG